MYAWVDLGFYLGSLAIFIYGCTLDSPFFWVRLT